MTCRSCGTALPSDAMFCGECGEAVLAPSLVGAAGVLAAESADAAGVPESYARFAPSADPDGLAPDAPRCPQCDSAIDPADVFCGECGFVIRASVPGPRAAAPEEDSPAPWPFSVEAIAETPAPARVEAGAEPSSRAEPTSAEPPVPPVSDSQPRKDPKMETDKQQDEAPAIARARTLPDPFPWGSDFEEDEDVEATRIVTATGGGDRFVLQFSTGESVTVSGSGLIGRNPSAQPGEYVDQLVSIFDAGKSVSKTHLEFGQESGRFWVSDRYSTNGSVVRQPESEPRRCEPGRRYFVVRGTRIDVGEQFFVVS